MRHDIEDKAILPSASDITAAIALVKPAAIYSGSEVAAIVRAADAVAARGGPQNPGEEALQKQAARLRVYEPSKPPEEKLPAGLAARHVEARGQVERLSETDRQLLAQIGVLEHKRTHAKPSEVERLTTELTEVRERRAAVNDELSRAGRVLRKVEHEIAAHRHALAWGAQKRGA